MKSIEQWLADYEVSHQHRVNRAIHKVAVPAIVLSIVVMLWPLKITAIGSNVGVVAALAALLFWVLLSWRLAAVMLVELVVMAALAQWWEQSWQGDLWQLGLGIFVVAWAFQFYGHYLEGKKPSFLQDLVFLLIGPLWTVATTLPSLGISSRSH